MENFSREPLSETRDYPLKRRMRLIILGAVALFILFSSIYLFLFRAGTTIVDRYVPLVHAASQVNHKVTTAHLWFEEIISGDRHEDIHQVWELLESADWYAGVMLTGGRNGKGTYLPLKDPGLREEVRLIRMSLQRFRLIAAERYESKKPSGVGSDIDQQFDAIFKRLVSRVNIVDEMLHHSIGRSLAEFRTIWEVIFLLVLFAAVLVTIFVIRFDRRQVQFITDITKANLKIEEKNLQLDYVENFDTVSNLPNRVLSFDRLNQALNHAQRHGQYVVLMSIDIDQFKSVNDSMGYPVGDRLLKVFGQRISDLIRHEDTLARTGGDEFVAILPYIESRSEAVNIAARLAREILESGGQVIDIDGEGVFIRSSIGIAIYPDDGEHANMLMRNADIALYQVKKGGRNHFQFYSIDMDNIARKRIGIEHELHNAIDREEFELYYQPIIDMDSERIVGTEVLVRWMHPTRGLVMPGEFIEVAEETGLIVRLGEWITRTACTQYGKWQSEGIGPGFISINLSAVQFDHPDLIGSMQAIRDACEYSTGTVQLEITETSLMQDSEKSVERMLELKGLGFRLAIDDFGTGYSSMAYLKNFPIDSMKIDITFVNDIDKDETSNSIIQGMIDLAHSLGLKTTAEGIETESQRMFLKKSGCTEGQGYLFDRPMDMETFSTRLRAEKTENVEMLDIASPENPN